MNDRRPSNTLGPIVWRVGPYSWESAQRLAAELDLPLVVATVLAGRGLTDPIEARAFLEASAPIPDPFLFGHMERAVGALTKAIAEQGRIVIHGDYDADGITATAVMVLGLRALGVDPEWYLPSRFKEGYGLSRTAVETIAAQGPCLLVTVDCGVNYPDEVALARASDLDVVVIDHHQPGPVLPDCHLVHAAVGQYPHADLCGVGLALKVLHALHVRLRGASPDTLPVALRDLLDLVAIGTVADLAPLVGENRYYVKEGLKLIGIGARTGLRALSEVAGCKGKADSGAVAFRLAPRLNAAGRLAEPTLPLKLLLSDDDAEAAGMASVLHELNGARQDVERQMLDEALAEVEALPDLPPTLVIAREGWHEGVVGIVAARLVERYHRPTILLGVRDGVAKGSGRSIAAYDLMAALTACSERLTVYGGHRQAVGLTLPVEEVGWFREAIQHHATGLLSPEELVPRYHADAVLTGAEVTADAARALATLEPFGSGNPRPRLLAVDAAVRRAERTRTGAHLRCVIEMDGVRAKGIGFGMGEAAEALRDDPENRVVGLQLRVDEWQGVLRPEFVIDRLGDRSDRQNPPCRPPMDDLDDRQSSEESVSTPDSQRPVAAGRSATAGPSVLRTIPGVRDARDSAGLAGSIAQVIGSGERVLILTASAERAFGERQNSVPWVDLARGSIVCLGRGDGSAAGDRLDAATVAIVEWDLAQAGIGLFGERAHVIVVDPPYRREHVEILRTLGTAGAHVHLCYGEDERRETTRFLKHVVHPRFAMVCVYRAMETGGRREDILLSAAEHARREADVLLTRGELERAVRILSDLGIERHEPGRATIEARNVSAYVEAEAEYEECSRLCLTL